MDIFYQPGPDQTTVASGAISLAASRSLDSGIPLLFHLGTPSIPFSHAVLQTFLPDTRLCSYMRPGYVGDAQPGRTVADAARDTVALLDAWGLDQVVMYGISGGGPHALACGALCPDRVAGIVLDSSPAPFGELTGPFDGMMTLNRISYEMAMTSPDSWRGMMRAALDSESVVDDPTGLIAKARTAISTDGLPAGAHPGLFLQMLDRFGDGWRDDTLAFMKPWGYSPSEVSVPVRVFYGAQDRMVPPAHGAHLVTAIPGALAEPYDGGHSAIEHEPDRVRRAIQELGEMLK